MRDTVFDTLNSCKFFQGYGADHFYKLCCLSVFLILKYIYNITCFNFTKN